MSTATYVDTTDIDIDLLAEELLTHWSRCGVLAGVRQHGDAIHTVRVAIAAIRAQGRKIVPGTGNCEDCVDLVPMIRFMVDGFTGTVRGGDIATTFAHTRQDAIVILSALSIQDRRIVAA